MIILRPAAERGQADHGWLAFHEGYLAHASGNSAPARAAGLAAADLGRRFDVPDLEMLGLALEGAVLVAAAEVDEGMRRLDEATATALEESGDPDLERLTCCFLVSACRRAPPRARSRGATARVRRAVRQPVYARVLPVGVRGRRVGAEMERRGVADGPLEDLSLAAGISEHPSSWQSCAGGGATRRGARAVDRAGLRRGAPAVWRGRARRGRGRHERRSRACSVASPPTEACANAGARDRA
jgi:hypothetical protein